MVEATTCQLDQVYYIGYLSTLPYETVKGSYACCILLRVAKLQTELSPLNLLV